MSCRLITGDTLRTCGACSLISFASSIVRKYSRLPAVVPGFGGTRPGKTNWMSLPIVSSSR